MKAICLLRNNSVVFLSTLLFDTYSFAGVTMLVEKFFNADAIIASSTSKSEKSVRPIIDRDVMCSSTDFAMSTSLIQCI